MHIHPVRNVPSAQQSHGTRVQGGLARFIGNTHLVAGGVHAENSGRLFGACGVWYPFRILHDVVESQENIPKNSIFPFTGRRVVLDVQADERKRWLFVCVSVCVCVCV